MRAVVLAGLALLPALAHAQEPRIEDRPLITAQGAGEVERAPDWVRVGFTVRGEGATPVEALTSLSQQRATATASIRAIMGLSGAEIIDGAVSTVEVRNPACSPTQPYQVQQRLSVGECAVVGAITSIDVGVKVRPATRAGDVASLAAQLGGKNVGLRGSGFDHDEEVQAEAARKAVADARRRADLLAQAAGGRLGELLRVQEAAGYANVAEVVVSGSRVAPAPPPPSPLPPTPRPVAQAVALGLTPQPLTRTARVTLIYALAKP